MFNRSSAVARAGLGVALMLSLVGCGGGGGGGGGTPLPPEAARITLSADNAARVSLEAVQAAQTSGDNADAANGGTSSSAARVNRAVRGALARSSSSPVGPLETEACTDGGSLTFTGFLLAIGDSTTVTFNDCNEDGIVANGTMRLTLVATTQTSGTLDVTLTNYQEAEGDLVERGNGAMRVTFTDEPQQSTISTSSDFFTIERLVAGEPRASRNVRDLESQDVETATGLTSTTSFVASGTFPELGEASFRVDTVTPLVTPIGQDHPTSGQLRISGAGGSNALLTVGADSVEIAIDTDGNGTVDQTIESTWDELLVAL